MKSRSILVLSILIFFGSVNAQENKTVFNFPNCKVAEAYKKEYQSFKIENPDSYYSCDVNASALSDFFFKFTSRKEAFEQYSKDLKAGIKPNPSIDDYTYPPDYELTHEEVAAIRANALSRKYPNVFESFGYNDVGTTATYKGAAKKIGSDVVSIWLLQSYYSSRRITQLFWAGSLKMQVAINCKSESYAFLQQIYYSAKDDTGESMPDIAVELNKAVFTDIPPNSLIKGLAEKQCKPTVNIKQVKEKR
jgi:hypothetical protein